jgi:4-aminobutyrate aminotransferase-like enzyme
LRELRRIADVHGIVLVADEIQTGFGRTGTMFAIEHAGVAPDLITFAKSIAGGLPLAGVVGRASIVDAVEPGGLGGTYAGNPLACAAALATLDAFESDDILARAERQGRAIRSRLDALAARYPALITDVRGIGAMLAIAFADVPDANGKSLGARVVAAAFDEGVVALTAGPKSNVLRILVPLVATDDDLARGFDALDRACARVLSPSSLGLPTEAQNSCIT